MHFSWISSAEAGKFVEVAHKVGEEVKCLGPARYLLKSGAKVV